MISVAIDGPSGAGKSSIARKAAERFGFIYVDTGAIYRTIGLAADRNGIDTKDKASVIALLPSLQIDLRYNDNGEQCMILNGIDVSAHIRLPEVSMFASDVSAIPEVREYLVDMQRDMAKRFDVIMDGRDIGTVILPDADLKIFLTASPEERAKRRREQLARKGTVLPFDEVLADMKRRDEQDTNRQAAPLKAAADAVIVDSTEYTEQETIGVISDLIQNRTGKTPKM